MNATYRTRLVTTRVTPFILLAAAPLCAQVAPPPPNLPAPLVLPAGPAITDWQPRGRAVPGMRIVLTGSQLRPADFRAVIGSTKYPLPVRMESSTATRIVLDVPDGALGKVGELVVSHVGTRGTLLESAYRIDPPNPQLVTSNDAQVPYKTHYAVFRVREFPGASANAGEATVTSSCGFKRSATPSSYANTLRDSTLTILLLVNGHYERSGSCTVDVTIRPRSATGAVLSSITLSTTKAVPQSMSHTIENTADLKSLLNPIVSRSGIGSICQADRGDWPGGERVGVHTSGGDIEWIIRGNLIDVSCDFRTSEWLLNSGVRLTRVVFSTRSVGDRCGLGSSYTSMEPINLAMTRGTIVLRPEAGMADGSEYTVAGEAELAKDGVVYRTNLSEWRTLWLPMTLQLKCKSMALPLGTASGMSGPTTSPQSYTVRLERVEFVGPSGITDLARYILFR